MTLSGTGCRSVALGRVLERVYFPDAFVEILAAPVAAAMTPFFGVMLHVQVCAALGIRASDVEFMRNWL
jgi:hypothetical protein